MSDPLRIIQVGAGAMGRTWLRNLRSSADVELIGLVDLDADIARQAATEAGFADIAVSTSLGQLLAELDADAVVDVTVPMAHQRVSTEALLAGVPVLCEKPLAETVSAGLSMIAAAEQSGQLLMVSQSRRYWSQLTAFRRQIAAIGPVGVVECDFFKAPRFGGFREVMPYPLLIDMAIHQFDLARDLSGSDPVAVYCESFNPGWSWFAGDAAARVTFEMSDGVHFGFTGSWCSPGLETSWNGSWRVSGPGGSALWDGDHRPVAERADGTPIDPALDEVPEQIEGSLAEFVTSVRTNTSPSSEAHRNVLSLAMVEGAIRSAELGRRVEIAEIIDAAYAEACQQETRSDLRAVLTGWSSVRDVVGSSAGRMSEIS